MSKTLTRLGNSLGLIIERPLLELQGIKADTRLVIRPFGPGYLVLPEAEGDRWTGYREPMELDPEEVANLVRMLQSPLGDAEVAAAREKIGREPSL